MAMPPAPPDVLTSELRPAAPRRLRLWMRLRQLGYRSLDEVAALPPGRLAEQLGPAIELPDMTAWLASARRMRGQG